MQSPGVHHFLLCELIFNSKETLELICYYYRYCCFKLSKEKLCVEFISDSRITF